MHYLKTFAIGFGLSYAGEMLRPHIQNMDAAPVLVKQYAGPVAAGVIYLGYTHFFHKNA